MVDRNSWLYSALEGLEQARRAISQLPANEIANVEVDLGICENALRERKAELGFQQVD